MQLYAYAPAEAIRRRPDLLDVLQAEHGLRGVIIRDADPAAFEQVRQRGLEALWLTPGLWGHNAQETGVRAVFPHLMAWDQTTFPAYESRFPMTCANTPGLAARNGALYAAKARELGASGVFGTHQRYHHPAHLDHLWGCTCGFCRAGACNYGVDLSEVEDFLDQLERVLRRLPINAWSTVEPQCDPHPLVGWWCALTDSDWAARWFAWKNATIERYLTGLAIAYYATAPELSFATNSFEPFLADLVGNRLSALGASAWIAPLLGYWSHHVQASLRNLAGWHMALASQGDLSGAEQALAAIMRLDVALHEPAAGIRQQIHQGAIQSAAARQPYYPVLNGTAANQYGGHAEQFPLREGLELAQMVAATGVILQGISQLLDNPELDFWY